MRELPDICGFSSVQQEREHSRELVGDLGHSLTSVLGSLSATGHKDIRLNLVIWSKHRDKN